MSEAAPLEPIENPGIIAGEATRAIRARMWNSDIRCGVGGYSITAEHASRMIEILGDAATPALRAAGFQPLINGEWCTRFRTEKGGEAYVWLTPPFGLLQGIAKTFPRALHRLSVSIQATTSFHFREMSASS